MLVPEGFLRPQGIGRNTHYCGLTFRKGVGKPCEVDGLPGAARGVRAWIEKQHEFFTRIVRQRNGFAAIARQAEGGRLCALGQFRFKAGGRVGSPA